MKYLSAIFFDIIVFLSLYYGFIHDSEGLINIGYFAGWFFGIIILVGLSSTKARESIKEKYKHQWIIWRIYDGLTDAAYTAFAIYSGWFVLATIYALSSIIKAQFKAEQEKRLMAT
ncbi:hypothetical protein [Yersinia aldovae]|uniref:hypothetical protein n=1 Tax=Yersinia aldovae TaxID=29483 RepID=UPI0011AA5F65|nr:hypothetical protein [Yersinia aldovae]